MQQQLSSDGSIELGIVISKEGHQYVIEKVFLYIVGIKKMESCFELDISEFHKCEKYIMI